MPTLASEPPDSLSDAKDVPRAAYRPAARPGARSKDTTSTGAVTSSDWILRSQPLTLFSSPALKLVSEPAESERDFRIRCQQAAREARDGAVETLRARFAPKVTRLNEKVRKARELVEREQQQVGQQKLQTAVSLGATMLGALMGRRSVSLSTLGRATTAAAKRRTLDEGSLRTSNGRAVRLQEAEAEFAAVEAELQQAIAALDDTSHATAPFDVVEIKPKRGNVDVRLVALAWQPVAG